MKIKIEHEMEIPDDELYLDPQEREIQIAREVKFAKQRIDRKWSDDAAWSIDYYLNEIMPQMLNFIKENKQGVPAQFFPDNYSGDDKLLEERAQSEWQRELDKMIVGFIAAKRISDWEYRSPDELAALLETFKIGMASFTEHYFSLWD